MSDHPGAFLLPLILALPLLGALFVMSTPKTETPLHRGIGLAITTITFLASLMILGYYRPGDMVPVDVYWLPLHGYGPPLRGNSY